MDDKITAIDDKNTEEILAVPAVVQWNPDKTTILSNTRPRTYLSTNYSSTVRAANKIKNKYNKKILGKKKFKKTSTDWLKTVGYLDTKNQDSINYIFVPPSKTEENTIPADADHYIKSEIEANDLKKSKLASKITTKNIVNKYRKMARKHPYKVPDLGLEESSNTEEIDKIDTIETLQDISALQPGKNAQLTAKKINEKYKKIREANKRKNKFKLPGEIVRIETVETSQGDVKVPVSIEKPKSSVRAAKKMTKKCDKIRKEKVKKLALIKGKEITEEDPPKKIH